MAQKRHIGILFGGKSTEHEISLQSARGIFEAIDKSKYDITLIGIDHDGQWHLSEDAHLVAIPANKLNSLALFPGQNSDSLKLIKSKLAPQSLARKIDVIFPVLHGIYGEDGSIQGLLKLANIPFVGAGILGSAIGMDKDVAKRLLRDAGLAIPKFLVFHQYEQQQIDFNKIKNELGSPFFVKPANTGSSIGVNKVRNESEFQQAVSEGFSYDHKILIEEYIPGREIECAVLGNDEPMASIPGEIIPHHEFYSYESKYLDENGATLVVPADLSEELVAHIQQLAIKAFQVLCCHGLARVDFFLNKDGKVYINEINTIPGFTPISMYPRLWQASGLSYSELINRLIELALEHFAKTSQLKTNFIPG